MYDLVDGIEIFYQLQNGKFVEHLSDDWDFGIKVIAYGGKPVYSPKSYVKINSRRVDTLLYDVINGIAYGENGVITMKDVRPLDNQLNHYQDLSLNDAQQAWFYSIKDYIPKNIILPALLNPNILINNQEVINFSHLRLLRISIIELMRSKMKPVLLISNPYILTKPPPSDSILNLKKRYLTHFAVM